MRKPAPRPLVYTSAPDRPSAGRSPGGTSGGASSPRHHRTIAPLAWRKRYIAPVGKQGRSCPPKRILTPVPPARVNRFFLFPKKEPKKRFPLLSSCHPDGGHPTDIHTPQRRRPSLIDHHLRSPPTHIPSAPPHKIDSYLSAPTFSTDSRWGCSMRSCGYRGCAWAKKVRPFLKRDAFFRYNRQVPFDRDPAAWVTQRAHFFPL